MSLTTFDDLTKGYDTAIVTTPSGWTFEIQPIAPGDIFILAGSPILQLLNDHGVDTDATADIAGAVNGLSDDEKLEMGTNEAFIEQMRKVVCAGVSSINFVMKKQPQCNKTRKEVSIYRLPLTDLIPLFNAISELTQPEDAMTPFRGNGKGQKIPTEPATDTPDMQSLPDTPIPPSVPNASESESATTS